MEISVPSRFACLKIEDDEPRNQNSKPRDAKKKNDKVPDAKKKPDKAGKTDKTKTAADKKSAPTVASGSKSRKKHPNSEQWEEWKQKDSELVNGHFEEDLQNAILLSKLEFEETELQRKPTKSDEKDKTNKKKKAKSISLEQFLNPNEKSNDKTVVNQEKNGNGKNFFESIKSDAKAVLTKEKVKEQRKKREENIDEIISIANLQEKLEQERAENSLLKSELGKAKAEIATVKSRNKTLCGMLGQGEMKDKAAVLLEVQRLNTVKNELTEEISRLHVELEQERSKSAALVNAEHHANKDKPKEHKEKKRNKKAA